MRYSFSIESKLTILCAFFAIISLIRVHNSILVEDDSIIGNSDFTETQQNLRVNKDANTISVPLDESINLKSGGRKKGKDITAAKKGVYNKETYEQTLEAVSKPFKNETTGAQYFSQGFWGGFVNQYQMFAAIMILAEEGNHKQILLESIRWRDNHGTKQHLRHEVFFDVVHWNSFYPVVPRLVRHDPVAHSDVSVTVRHDKPIIGWKEGNEAINNATNVFPLGLFDAQYSNKYGQYTRGISERGKPMAEWDKVMTATAFRPHPELQMLIDSYFSITNISQANGFASKPQGSSLDYIMLHARIEPDMQMHPVCKDKKVTNFTDILTSIQNHFPEPPAEKLILALDRRLLERGIDDPKNTNVLQKHNLNVLNEIIKSGLWGGRVKVMEAGVIFAEQSRHPIYSKFPSLTGSIVDFFLAQNARVFIGTEVSTWSTAAIRYRFYKSNLLNYAYRPGEVFNVTPVGTKSPPGFRC